MFANDILRLGLTYGLALSAFMTAFIVATLYFRPMIWLGDAPAEVQAALGPMSDEDRRFKQIAGAASGLVVVGLLVAALVQLARAEPGPLRFADAALLVFIIITVFNVVDLVLIDWLLLVAWRPRFIVLPGAEVVEPGVDLAGGYAYHFKGFLKGLAGSAVAAAVVGALAVAIDRLV